MAMRHDHGFRGGETPVVHPMTNTGITMWDVGEMIFGRGIPSNAGFETEGVVCFDTPFGRVCLNLNVADLRKNEGDARKLTLQDALQEVLSRPRIKGICFRVCTPIGCFEVCP